MPVRSTVGVAQWNLERLGLKHMIGLSRVGMIWSHFLAETSRYLAPYLEHFQAFLELQNLRRKTSRRVPEVNEDRKSISDFNLAHRSPISAQHLCWNLCRLGWWSIQMKIPKKIQNITKSKINHKIILSKSLKLSLCEVVVLVCTSNPQSMSAKLHLQVDKRKIGIKFQYFVTGMIPNTMKLYWWEMPYQLISPLKNRWIPGERTPRWN